MMDVPEVQRWLGTLSPGSSIAIDDGGLAIVEILENGQKSEAYLEIGGEPEKEAQA